MKHLLAIVVSGVGAGAALFAALRFSEPAAARREDPWLVAFRGRGLNSRLLSISHDPSRYFLVREWRASLDSPAYFRAEIREYLVENIRVQVVVFPAGCDLDWIETGKYRHPETKRVYHVRRAGRHVLAFENYQRVPVPFPFPRSVPDSLRDRIAGAFEDVSGD